ncbi:triose-phosphate transporter family protein, partial [Escherichia coli]|nr:triose-phosphate transporter family protein [Escherichia coli]
ATSPVSLAMVSIPFHQIIRSTCPFFAVLIYRFRYGRSYPRDTYLALIPLILGVGLAPSGDHHPTAPRPLLPPPALILAVV